MVVNTGLSFGPGRAPLRPTNRRIVPTRPSGVTVVSMAEATIRKRGEVTDLRAKVASLERDLKSAMEALAAANKAVDMIRSEKSVIAESAEKLRQSNESLEKAVSELEALRKSESDLKSEIETLKASNEEMKKQLASSSGGRKKKPRKCSDTGSYEVLNDGSESTDAQ